MITYGISILKGTSSLELKVSSIAVLQRTETSKLTSHATTWPMSASHWVCTCMSSSSSLCLRALYRNISRILHASPGQTTVTTASSEQWTFSSRSLCFSLLHSPADLNTFLHTDVKVYSDAVIIQVRSELKAEWSARGCSLRTPSAVNM